MRIVFPIKSLLILLVLGVSAYFLLPYLFIHVAIWQREFNQLMSGYLHQIHDDQTSAGNWLILISFLYGVFHALGPGHGKFIIATYLSTHQTQLKTSMKLTLLSSLMQGLVAVTATSIVVVLLNLSSRYFQLTQLWLERIAFLFLLLLGLVWCYQHGKKLVGQHWAKYSASPRIVAMNVQRGASMKVGQRVMSTAHSHAAAHCGCGHQHAPNEAQLAQANDWKSQFFVICSIGLRPCSGAIFILFLAYMLDLYQWGIMATFAMAMGTGLTLSGFALIVLYARHTAIKIGHWYQISPSAQSHVTHIVKFIAGIVLIFFAMSLLYGTTLSVTGGAALFGRQ